MDIRTAKTIVAAAETLGIDAELREDYSGRSMFGATTAGVVVDRIVSLLAAVAEASSVMEADDQTGFVLDLRNVRLDSMGHGVIVY